MKSIGHVNLRRRIAGSLIGQCLGDSLGFVVEGQSRSYCLAYVDKFLMTGNAGLLRRPQYAFGQYTDDSQLARELAESIVDHGGFEPNDYANRIAALFAEERIVGRGRATEAAARRLAQVYRRPRVHLTAPIRWRICSVHRRAVSHRGCL
jgi:ADP-ribosylglycohydrolase